MAKKIASIVLNNVVNDARVLREAESLIEHGHTVTVFGITPASDRIQQRYNKVPIMLLPYGIHTRNWAFANALISLFLCVVFASIIALIWLYYLGDFFGGWLSQYSAQFSVFQKQMVLIVVVVAMLVTYWKRRGLINLALRAKNFVSYILKDYHRVESEKAVHFETLLAEGGGYSKYMFMKAMLKYGTRGWCLRLFALQRAMYVHLRDLDFDVIHCHDFTMLPLGLALKKHNKKLKIVYDSHELFSAVVADHPLRQAWVKYHEERASSQIDACITVNNHIGDVLHRYYPKLPKPVIICNATRLPEEEIAYDGRLHEAVGINRDKKILLYQGGFAEHRGLEALLLSALLLNDDWVLIFMGAGNYGSYLKDLAKSTGNDNRIHFLESVPQSELAYWTAGASVGAVPYEMVSLNHLYCSPNKLWEYPRSGVPLLCCDAPEMASRVNKYGFGWVIPKDKNSPSEIANIVNNITKEDLAQAKVACRTFLTKDNWATYEKRLLKLYDEL